VSAEPPVEPVSDARPPLFVVRGDATPEEVAALVAVLQGVAAAQVSPAPARPRPEWSAHHRKVRASYPSGPGGWRSSAMPR
jgi:acyl-CoA carboxylase epsilon subunit